MSKDARQPGRDSDNLSMHGARQRGRRAVKRQPHGKEAFECVESENEITPSLTQQTHNVRSADVPATVLADIDSESPTDEISVRARANQITTADSERVKPRQA